MFDSWNVCSAGGRSGIPLCCSKVGMRDGSGTARPLSYLFFLLVDIRIGCLLIFTMVPWGADDPSFSSGAFMAVFAETERDRQIREQVLAFRDEEVEPRIARVERGAVDYELPQMMARLGWASPSYGPEYGGLGTGDRWKVIMLATLGERSPAAAGGIQLGIIPAEAIAQFGDERQKREYLEAIAVGACMPTIATTEPGAGGDLLAMQTSAEPVKGGY